MVEKSGSKKLGMFRKLSGLFILMMILGMFQPKKAAAQATREVIKTDSITYSLYLQKKWDAMILEGEKALKHGIDFYYLQTRMAIAWYEKRNYRHAISYFENALKYDPNNQFVLEYLYYAYLFAGRDYDMRRINTKLSDEVRNRNKMLKNKFLQEFYFEGAYGLAGDQSAGGQRRRRNQNDSIYTETWKYEQLSYFHAGAKFSIFPWLSLYQGYSRLSSDYSQEISYFQQPVETFVDKAQQDEFYGNLEISPVHGLKITPAWHYSLMAYNERRAFYDSINYTLGFDTVSWNKEHYTLFLSVKKDLANFAVEAFGNYSDFELKTLKQAGLALYFYPYGNTSLYTKTSLEYVWNNEDNYFVFNQLLGFKLAEKTWLETDITVGNLKDYAEKNAYIIYNAPEEINYKIEAFLLHNLSKHLDISFRYRYMQRENQLLTYTDENQSTIITTKYPYHTFIAGLTWRL